MSTKIKFPLLLVLTFISFHYLTAQSGINEPRPIDKLTIGLGIGLDCGGFGGNIIIYPQKNVGIFAGGGYALAGFGWNAGLKLRLISDSPDSKISPFLLAMYGYNSAITVVDKSSLN